MSNTKQSYLCNPGVKIPSGFGRFYRMMRKRDVEQIGADAESFKFGKVYPGYEKEVVGYAIARDPYYDRLSDVTLDILDILSDGSMAINIGQQPTYVSVDEIYEALD